MEQIEIYTARIKDGHAVIYMNFQANFNDDSEFLSVDLTDTRTTVTSEILQEFLDSCVGEYKINNDDYTIEFSDITDFVNYLLTIDDNDGWSI